MNAVIAIYDIILSSSEALSVCLPVSLVNGLESANKYNYTRVDGIVVPRYEREKCREDK